MNVCISDCVSHTLLCDRLVTWRPSPYGSWDMRRIMDENSSVYVRKHWDQWILHITVYFCKISSAWILILCSCRLKWREEARTSCLLYFRCVKSQVTSLVFNFHLLQVHLFSAIAHPYLMPVINCCVHSHISNVLIKKLVCSSTYTILPSSRSFNCIEVLGKDVWIYLVFGLKVLHRFVVYTHR